jgi:ATP-dependent DNA helicase RecG
VPDLLPEEVRAAHDFLPARQALQWLHRPASWAQKEEAAKRLRFDEAFVTQTVLAQRRAALLALDAQPRTGRDGGLLDRFDERLPFELTAGQQEVGTAVLGDLATGHPMHRLLQGEVGSGKTVVALRAMLRVVDSGGQAALLAPTEVLAQQHHRSMTAMLGDLAAGGMLGGAADGTQVALLTGSLGAAARREAMLDAASGSAGIVIGTHALLEDKVQFADLGFVVVDEQHRFGVEQRAALAAKSGGFPPHVLVMTATPIPRTVAMTVFGDLETSTLRELPAGRAPIQTSVVPLADQPSWLERAYQRIREEVAKGHQVYVVCPRIGGDADDGGPQPADGEDARPMAAVEEVAPGLAEGPLRGLRLEMLHGRLAPDAKDQVMRSFAAGDVDVLVSTTVIEVGVDVANATMMVVLDAERFGVSQLHQLRGRVGRGGLPGLCLLVTQAAADTPARERLDAVAATTDGFELSRVDLEQRREGDVLGSSQSGRRSSLRLLHVLEHEDVILEAREIATALVGADPTLADHQSLAEQVRRLHDTDQADYLEKA